MNKQKNSRTNKEPTANHEMDGSSAPRTDMLNKGIRKFWHKETNNKRKETGENENYEIRKYL